MREINLTPEQVKTILNWDYYENGNNIDIDLDGAEIEWSTMENLILARWYDKADATLRHTKEFYVSGIFKASGYKDYLNMGEELFYQKIADYINDYFKDNKTVSFIPF